MYFAPPSNMTAESSHSRNIAFHNLLFQKCMSKMKLKLLYEVYKEVASTSKNLYRELQQAYNTRTVCRKITSYPSLWRADPSFQFACLPDFNFMNKYIYYGCKQPIFKCKRILFWWEEGAFKWPKVNCIQEYRATLARRGDCDVINKHCNWKLHPLLIHNLPLETLIYILIYEHLYT